MRRSGLRLVGALVALLGALAASAVADSPIKLFKEINNGPDGSTPQGFTLFNGYLYFQANDPVTGAELWRTQGDAASTTLIKDINPGPADGSPAGFTPFNGLMYFSAHTDALGYEPWVTDGTEAGTHLLMDINPGSASSNAGGFQVLNGAVYFAAYDGVHGTELWRSDGTAAGTGLVKRMFPYGEGHPRSIECTCKRATSHLWLPTRWVL